MCYCPITLSSSSFGFPPILWKHPAPRQVYTLSLHDALPIYRALRHVTLGLGGRANGYPRESGFDITAASERSEEHTSELQSQSNLVCRLLLEKKNLTNRSFPPSPRRRQDPRYRCAGIPPPTR